MIKATEFDALIFDCDGVLVNSEEIVQVIERQHLARVGLTYEQHDFVRRFLGLTTDAFRAELSRDADRLGLAAPTDAFYAAMRSAIRTAYKTELKPLPGVAPLARRWPTKLAVASSSEAASLMSKLKMTGLADIFGEHIYSADRVNAGKPDPAVFLYAARRLKVAPERCLAIEDSVNGVISATAAGMTTFGYVGGLHCLPEHTQLLADHGANAVYSDYASMMVALGLS